MASEKTPKFHNDMGVATIVIGDREFECTGATAPFDHPHVYLDMGDETEIVCPYCSTLFRFDEKLEPGTANPPEAVFPS